MDQERPMGKKEIKAAIKETKDKAEYYYKQFQACMDILYELDESEGDNFWAYLESIGVGARG